MNTIGIDLSPAMVRCASRLNPALEFRTGDMTMLDLPPGSLVGLIAFYSIVHTAPNDLGVVMRQFRKVLASDGLALLAFHAGEEVVHVDDLFGAPVDLDFQFHFPDVVAAALRAARLTVIERAEREPYAGVEYPSRRCYLLARAA